MSNLEEAVGLLREILGHGHRVDNPLTDSSWSVPIELKWKIEKFVEKMNTPEKQHE